MDSFGEDVLGRDLVGDVDDKLVRDLARDSKRRPLPALASPCRVCTCLPGVELLSPATAVLPASEFQCSRVINDQRSALSFH
jgi:hypothetical protein